MFATFVKVCPVFSSIFEIKAPRSRLPGAFVLINELRRESRSRQRKSFEINRTVPALKSSLINTSDRASHLKVADPVIEDGASDVQQREEPPVLLSIPALGGVGDRLVSTSTVELDAPPASTVPVGISSTVVPLSVPEANLLQSCVQATRQQVIELASGSVFWRLFVGSGVAILMGAVTLILLGPSEDRLPDDETAAVISSPRPIVESPANQSGESHAKTTKSRIELTVNESPHDGPVPAEYDDPFTAANMVTANVDHAIHVVDPSSNPGRTAVQTVSHSQTVQAQPAWLSGTIDIEDDAEPALLKRKYERSRPSNR